LTEQTATAVESKSPLWKNPFAIAFVLGIIFLTALPFMQRRFLKAPPPLKSLTAWSLLSEDGNELSSSTLAGAVWIANFLPAACDAACLKRAELFARLGTHFDDLSARVRVVTFVVPNGPETPALVELKGSLGAPRWTLAHGSSQAMSTLIEGQIREAFVATISADAGTDMEGFAAAAAIVLVDQNGGLRGFWREDDVGRGNAVNAARLIARYGPNP
jgi:cytochrome oxidase Cu insertion factor (SCO1/SenC/PrrC family)